MIIGFDGSRAFFKNKTGTENYSYQLLKHLLKIDKSSQYIVYVRPGTINDKILQANVQYRRLSWPRLWTQGGLALQTFKDPLDVLFVPSHTLPIVRRLGLKTVMTVHDLGVEYLPYHHQLKQQLYLKYITRYQLKTTTKLVAVSKATKEDLVKKASIDPKKISVIYEGYDTDLFRAQTRNDTLVNSLQQYKLEAGKYFLFVGTVQPRKNLARLIEAFAQIVTRVKNLESRNKKSRLSTLATSDLELAIVGQRGWLSDEIYKLPKQLGIEDKVKFLGYVPNKDMPALYSGAIALLFPSLFEGFGLPILEAQACDCPVITSNLSSMPEVAGKGAILVNPYSLDDIIRGMIEVQSSKFKVQSLVKAGFKNVKKFSWEKCARETLKVLEEV